MSILTKADAYKYSHFNIFPKNITNNNSYIESRGIDEESKLPADAEVLFFGLQIYLKKYLNEKTTKEEIDRMAILMPRAGLPFNKNTWDIIVNEFDGYLPVEIEAIPEGTAIDPSQVMFQVRATDDRFAEIASFIETSSLRAIWYTTTVATLSREVKKIIKLHMLKTCDTLDGLPFKLHDFGARGVSSHESAVNGGLAHLVNFMGTDTVEALFGAIDYYNVPLENPVGFSIPASEHSTITSWGRDGELDAYENFLDIYGGEGKIISCVSDSYDIYNAVDNLWPSLKDKIVDSGTTLVVRPDSGDPVTVVINILKSLEKSFGYETNSKGYKVLNSVRVIQGDGIDIESLEDILNNMTAMGFSTENIAFGMGGALLQKVNRDTLKFAQKTNAIEKDGEWIDVYKDPVGSSFKKSKKGRLALIKENGKFKTIRFDELGDRKNYLEPVWRNGKLLKDYTFDEVRQNAEVL
jgi:nicotinamide phosphoribosyltransferase